MNTRTFLGLSLVTVSFAITGCEQKPNQNSTVRDTTPPKATTAGADADNTVRNKADRDTATKTPLNQSNSSEAIKTTADIRRAILDDKSMSLNAQNCKIITDSAGVVTLRGPVASQAEKDAIESIAKATAGVNSVANELEVKFN